MKIKGVYRSMTATEKKAALAAIAKLERQMTPPVFAWAARKHLAIIALKRTAAREMKRMQAEIARLQQKIA